MIWSGYGHETLPGFSQALNVSQLPGFKGFKVRPAGFEPATYGLGNRPTVSLTGIAEKTSADSDSVLAFCLAFIAKKSPDLALLVERWDSLPEALRAGISAMVQASGGERA